MAYISKINMGGMDYDIRDKVLEQVVTNIKPIVNQGTINNAADEEDLTSENGLLKLKNRSSLNGMGYVILRKNKTFAEQVTQANTIYEIRYDFDLNGAEVTIPNNCILKFAGGSIKNCSNLVGYDTLVLSSPYQIFDSVLSGTWNVKYLYPEWFGAKNDGITDSTQALQMAIDFAHKINGCQIKLSIGKYLVSNTLYLYRKVSIIGCGGFCQVLNNQMNTTTQIICDFSNPNSWCFDTYGQGTLAEYNDIFFFNNERKSPYERNESIILKDFSIACPRQKPIYGAIRLWNSLQGLIENVSIYGTIFGICTSESWAMCIKNCFIGTYRYGIGFGEYCTTDTVINVYLSRHRWTLPIDFVLPVVDDNFYPPYIAEKNEDGTYKELTELIKKNFSSAFLFSGKNYISKICIISPTIEYYECAFCGSYYSGEVTNLYLEGFASQSLTTRTKYVAWIGTKGVGSYQATFSISGHNGAAVRYEKTKYTYGSIGTGIHVKNSWFGTCYTPTNKYNPIAMSKMYIFEAPLNNSLPFYDEYDIENPESAIACPMKIIKGYDTVFASNSGVASNIINTAIDVNNRTPLHEALKRCCEYNIDRVVLVSYVTLEKQVNELKNKTIKFYNNTTDEVSSITLDDYPLKINNSELQFISDGISMILTSTKKINYAIEVKGNCSIKSIGENNNIFNGISSTGIQCLLHVVGDSDVTITCDSQADLTYKLADNRLLFDRNVPYKYSIKVYHKNGLFLKELCNYKGTTTNRPNFTGIQGSVGFEYYDSDLKKKILWNGTDWVNLDGTAL